MVILTPGTPFPELSTSRPINSTSDPTVGRRLLAERVILVMTGRSDAGAGACVAAAMIGPDAGGVDAGTVDSAGTYPESPLVWTISDFAIVPLTFATAWK